MFPAFYELLLPTILLRGGARERESRERGIGNLLGDFGSPWTEVNGVWVRGGRRLHNSDKKFALTMGAEAEAEGGGQGWGGVQEPEGGREAASPATYPNELIRTYKNSNEEKI